MRAIERIWETMTKRRNNNPQVLSSVDAKVEGQLHIEDSVVLEGGPDQESALLASDDGALSVNGREVVTLDEEGNLPYDVAVPDLANVLAGKANVNHTHTIEDVTDFDPDDKADTDHTHTIEDVTDFDGNDYASASHTHDVSDIIGLESGSAGGSFSGGETVVGSWRNGSDFGATVVRSYVEQAGSSNKNVSSYIKYGPGSLEPAPTAKWLENQNNPVGRYWAPFGA